MFDRITEKFYRIQVRGPGGYLEVLEGVPDMPGERALRVARRLARRLRSEWSAAGHGLARRTWRGLERVEIDPRDCEVEAARPAKRGEPHENGYVAVARFQVPRSMGSRVRAVQVHRRRGPGFGESIGFRWCDPEPEGGDRDVSFGGCASDQ